MRGFLQLGPSELYAYNSLPKDIINIINLKTTRDR